VHEGSFALQSLRFWSVRWSRARRSFRSRQIQYSYGRNRFPLLLSRPLSQLKPLRRRRPVSPNSGAPLLHFRPSSPATPPHLCAPLPDASQPPATDSLSLPLNLLRHAASPASRYAGGSPPPPPPAPLLSDGPSSPPPALPYLHQLMPPTLLASATPASMTTTACCPGTTTSRYQFIRVCSLQLSG
jgi:hypothetical protein